MNDTLDESDETVLLPLLNPGGHGATLGAQSHATLTITDNDTGGEMAFSAATYAANEGTSVLVTVKRTGGTASGVSVDYATRLQRQRRLPRRLRRHHRHPQLRLRRDPEDVLGAPGGGEPHPGGG